MFHGVFGGGNSRVTPKYLKGFKERFESVSSRGFKSFGKRFLVYRGFVKYSGKKEKASQLNLLIRE